MNITLLIDTITQNQRLSPSYTINFINIHAPKKLNESYIFKFLNAQHQKQN